MSELSARRIGELMAAARHDLHIADPAEVGMNGVPIRAWREAYAEGCKDMANAAVADLPRDAYEDFKKAVGAALKTKADELATSSVTPTESGA